MTAFVVKVYIDAETPSHAARKVIRRMKGRGEHFQVIAKETVKTENGVLPVISRILQSKNSVKNTESLTYEQRQSRES